MVRLCTILLAGIFVPTLLLAQATPTKKLKITILSTMVAERGIGEWGFAALVETDSIRILFDAGAREQTVWENAKEMKVDLSGIQHLILSHNHRDHTGGWLSLRENLASKNYSNLSITHVGNGFFTTRLRRNGEENNERKIDSVAYAKTGGRVIIHNRFEILAPGIYLTGPVPRKHPEKNYLQGGFLKTSPGPVEDNVPEDMSLVVETEKGLVIISGCGHSGIINTIDYSRDQLQQQKVFATIGGFHLLENKDDQNRWTGEELKKAGVQYFIGAHCTGIEAVYQIRQHAGLSRSQCIVGSVGSGFDLQTGIVAGSLVK